RKSYSSCNFKFFRKKSSWDKKIFRTTNQLLNMSKNILYILEDDISQDTGSAINERGLVKKLLINEVSVLIPFPDKNLDKEILNNKLLFFTKKINRKNPIKYFNYLLDKIRKIKKITKENKIKTLVFRWGPIPIDILYYGRQGGYTIFLKHLTFL